MATPGFCMFLSTRMVSHSRNSGISKRLPGRFAASHETVLTSIDCFSPFWGRTKIQFKEHVGHQ